MGIISAPRAQLLASFASYLMLGEGKGRFRADRACQRGQHKRYIHFDAIALGWILGLTDFVSYDLSILAAFDKIYSDEIRG